MAYELMIVAASSGNSDSLISRVEKIVKETSATNIKVDRLGRKKLAYPIKKHTEADYFLIDFDLEGDGVNTISGKLRMEQEELLRHILIKKKAQRFRIKPGKKALEVKVEEEKKPTVTVVTKVRKVAQVPQVLQVEETKETKGTKGTKVITKKKVTRKATKKKS